MKKCFQHPNKKRYFTEKEASKILLLRGLEKPELKIYKCEACNGWHLTSKINL